MRLRTGTMAAALSLLAAGCNTSATDLQPASPPMCEELGPARQVDGPLSDDRAIASAQEIRASLGYPSDQATAARVLAGAQDDFMAGLTPSEAAEIRSRPEWDGKDIRQYAAAFPDEYGGLWRDNSIGGGVIVAFTGDAERHRTALVAVLPPGTPLTLVSVAHSKRYLEEIEEAAWASFDDPELGIYGVGTLIMSNRTSIDVGYIEESEVAALAARFDPTAICILGTTVPPAPDIQPSSGENWRLLADEAAIDLWGVSLATSQPGLELMWSKAQFSTPLPEVDFDAEVAFVLSPTVSTTCPEIRFVDLVFDETKVYGVFADPTENPNCGAIATNHGYVVAVPRAALPGDSFALQLDVGQTECSVCHDGRDGFLTVDLADPYQERSIWGESILFLARVGTGLADLPSTVVYEITRPENPDYPFDTGLIPYLPGTEEPAAQFGYERAFVLEAWEAECLADDCSALGPALPSCVLDGITEPFTVMTAVVTFTAEGCSWDTSSSPLPPDK